MNTAAKLNPSPQKVVPLKPKRTRREKLSPEIYPVTRGPIEKLPTRNYFPLWLRSIFLLHNTVSFLTFILIAASLGIYAITVYTPQTWSKEYKKLKTLQRDERQLTATNETLKNQLAQQAERPETGLVDPSSSNAPLFLPVQTLPQVKPAPIPIPRSETIIETTPLGY
jgi:hypothetical protein